MQSLAQEIPRSPIYGHRCYNKKASIFICSASCTVFLSIQSRVLRVLEDCYYPSLVLLVQACLQWVFYCPTWKLYWGSRHRPHCAVQPQERTPKHRENCIAERQVLLLKEILLVLGCRELQGWAVWLGCRDGCMAQLV